MNTFLYAGADSRKWQYYGEDDFTHSTLRLCWQVQSGKAEPRDGWLELSGKSDAQVALKGLYQVHAPIIYLYWPWAIETRIDEDKLNELSHAGIKIQFEVLNSTGGGEFWGNMSTANFSTPSELLKFGIKKENDLEIFCSIDERLIPMPESIPFPMNKGVYLRVEGTGQDQCSLRVGFKADLKKEWNWSPVFHTKHPVQLANPMAIYASTAGRTSEEFETIARFDYVCFQGISFDPGVFHRNDSPFLENLTSTQKRIARQAGRSVNYSRFIVPEVREPLPAEKPVKKRVPNTLDLAERMRLSVHCLTECVDKKADCEPYSHFFANPKGWGNSSPQYNPDVERGAPCFLHDIHGYNTGIGEGWIEILPLLRLGTGSVENATVSQIMMDNMRRMIDQDGLPKVPLMSRPWGCFTGWWVHDPVTGGSLDTDLTYTGEYAWGRFLSTLAAWYAVTGNDELKREIESMVDAFKQLDQERPNRPLGMTVEYGLVQAYKFTGYEPAKRLATKLLEKTRQRVFDPEGSFAGHFHGITFSLLSMAELAALTGDEELMDFVQKGYEFALRKGWPIVGFYPEGTDQDPPCQETCSFTHLPKIAILLQRSGRGDWWEEIDQLVRNQMVENQLTHYEWIYDLAEKIPNPRLQAPDDYDGLRDVGKRLIGGFASYASLNDYFQPIQHAPGPIVGCCSGNGAVVLYHVWKNMLEFQNEQVFVHLLLNRASPVTDVLSYLPYEGKVEIHLKEAKELWVRIPEWASKEQVVCRMGKNTVDLKWNERYCSPGLVNSGEVVEIEFPVIEKTVNLKIDPIDARVIFRGNTVVDIEPEGDICPLYRNRERYRSGKTQWESKPWYASTTEIDW